MDAATIADAVTEESRRVSSREENETGIVIETEIVTVTETGTETGTEIVTETEHSQHSRVLLHADAKKHKAGALNSVITNRKTGGRA